MIKVAVIAYSSEFAHEMKQNLELFFSQKAEFIVYTTENLQNMEIVPEKIVVISAYVIFKSVENKLRTDAVLQVFSLSLSDSNLDRLKAIKDCKKALLVNVDYYNCMETITQIYEAGYQNIDLIPYSGESSPDDPDIELAITPGETHLIPKNIKKTIDIGHRIVDMNCIIQLADKLGIKDIFSTKEANEARRHMVLSPNGLDKILDEAESVNDKILAIIEHMDQGVMITDISGKIYLANQNAKEIAGTGHNLEGFPVQNLIPRIDLTTEYTERIVKAFGKTILVTNSIMYAKQKKSGNIILMCNYEDMEKRQFTVRKKLLGKTHCAYHTFADIAGNSAIIKSRIEQAKRMSKSRSSILITGPSGCGKEIFAQSIHQFSERSPYNFVAINCAAIPDNLLESELFGYEAGAFTGAKKEGKIGFFELAHKGTIFLDEIGELPLPLQSKLLRVIEERSFSRIGSSRLIHVDIRIIAATNQNLEEQVNKKQFRSDLFYRLNVLPLDLPPMKDRENDALELLYYFRDQENLHWKLAHETEQFLKQYPWPGNVREIRNLSEYLSNQDTDSIMPEHLPGYILRNNLSKSSLSPEPNEKPAISQITTLKQSSHLPFILREGPNILLHFLLLNQLTDKKTPGISKGRLQLHEELKLQNYSYSEVEIRTALRKLSEGGFIRSKRGAGGSCILPEGTTLLYELKQLI